MQLNAYFRPEVRCQWKRGEAGGRGGLGNASSGSEHAELVGFARVDNLS